VLFLLPGSLLLVVGILIAVLITGTFLGAILPSAQEEEQTRNDLADAARELDRIRTQQAADQANEKAERAAARGAMARGTP